MTKRTTESVLARMKAKEMADIEDCRKVMDKLYQGVPFTNACFQYRITPASFWKRVQSNVDLRRELAAACITQAWDRSDRASAEDMRHLATFVKISRDMAASLSPEDWSDKTQPDVNVQVDNRSIEIVAKAQPLLEYNPDAMAYPMRALAHALRSAGVPVPQALEDAAKAEEG